MDIMASLCGYQKGINQLKSTLHYTAIQLESEKLNAELEFAKQNECIKKLARLLKTAYKERDEAREYLQKLLNSYHPSPSADTKEAYDFYRFNTNGSSYLPDSSTGNPCNFEAPEPNPIRIDSSELVSIDCDYEIILKEMVKDKPLPQKGKLLEAVLDAAPLLQTLLAAGSPLPQWKNPPPLLPVVGIQKGKEIGFTWMISNQSQLCPSQNGTDYESCHGLYLNNMRCSCDDLNWDFHGQSYSDGN